MGELLEGAERLGREMGEEEGGRREEGGGEGWSRAGREEGRKGGKCRAGGPVEDGAARGVGLGGWEENAPEEVSVTLTAALDMGKKPCGG